MTTSQATFGEQGGEIAYTQPLRIAANSLDPVRNIADVTYNGGAVTVKNATSVTAYGERTDSINAANLESSDGWLARQLGNYRVRLRKDPSVRVPLITVNPHDSTGSAATVLATLIALELGDRVTVNRRPTGGTGTLSQQVRIEGIRFSLSPATGFRWSAYLSPAPPSATEAGYFITNVTATGDGVTCY
jgi:hypothetical protein